MKETKHENITPTAMKKIGFMISSKNINDIQSLRFDQKQALWWFTRFSSGESWAKSIGYEIEQKISPKDFKILKSSRNDKKQLIINDLRSQYPNDDVLLDYLNDIENDTLTDDDWVQLKEYASTPDKEQTLATSRNRTKYVIVSLFYSGMLYLLMYFHFMSLITKPSLYLIESLVSIATGEIGSEIFDRAIVAPIKHHKLHTEIGITFTFWAFRMASSSGFQDAMLDGSFSGLVTTVGSTLEEALDINLIENFNNLNVVESNLGIGNPYTQKSILTQCKADIDNYVNRENKHDNLLISLVQPPSADDMKDLGMDMVSTWLKCKLFLTRENEMKVSQYALDNAATHLYDIRFTLPLLTIQASGNTDIKFFTQVLKFIIKVHGPLLRLDLPGVLQAAILNPKPSRLALE